MAYVSVPKDLSKIKSKVLFSLTQRQLICFSAGAVIGVPLFFLLRNRIGVSSAALVMMFVMVRPSCWPCTRRTGSRWKRCFGTSSTYSFCGPSSGPIAQTISMP